MTAACQERPAGKFAPGSLSSRVTLPEFESDKQSYTDFAFGRGDGQFPSVGHTRDAWIFIFSSFSKTVVPPFGANSSRGGLCQS